MMFWYMYCLTSLKDCLVTSNHHRQRREEVKQRLMRLIVSVCDNRRSNVYHYATQRGLKGPESWCSNGTTVDKDCELSPNIGGFIMLSSAGAEVFTNKKFLPRARDADHGVSRKARLCQVKIVHMK
ncbi:hypothetical protein V202x_21510 [Gimesia aquarii]|uniref:Uncharacterized protein n=1 Tax=Gimesia aquarii TaxID=2527964 RepID=A0A517WU39_9PLAN|nr:hypothetical protein V202x_21510 [Gimesia aquarii]